MRSSLASHSHADELRKNVSPERVLDRIERPGG